MNRLSFPRRVYAEIGARTLILPQNLLTTQHTLLENFETLGSWTGSGNVTADTTNFRTGTQSLMWTVPVTTTGQKERQSLVWD